MALPDKKERQIGRREMFTNPAYYAGSAAAALGGGVAAHNVGRAGGWRALRGGRLAATAGALGAGMAGGFAGADHTLKRQNRARVKAGYPERDHFGRQKKSKKSVSKGLLDESYDSAKLDRAIRARRALKAGGLTALAGVPVTAGALAGVAAIGAKRDRDYKKKKKANVEKSLGLFARPMTMRRAKAAGRLARIKTDDAAVGAARGAGRATRYMNANAMPLLVGGSIGGGATMAGMQMSERRKRMSKSDTKHAYVTGRLSKGLASALRPKTRAGKLVPAMRNPAVRARVDANIQGRAAGSYMATGTAYGAGRAPGNVMSGRNARANSRSVFRRPEA